MIRVDFTAGNATARIVLRPNRSWTWRANLYFLSTLGTVSIISAVAFGLRGFWVVLPFTCIELLLLTVALYFCVRRTHLQEVVTFSDQQVTIEKGHDKPEQVYVFDRFFSRIFIKHPTHRWHSTQIAIQARSKKVQIGSFLPPGDKQELISQLRTVVNFYNG